jgi:hypothetical protein
MAEFGKGYLTPDNLPEDSQCRILQIPNDVQWLSVFMGALLALAYPENWQEWGELTQQEAADAALDVIWNAYENSYCSLDVTAPYWDDDSDVAAISTPNSQAWFGELHFSDPTWVAELQEWTFTSFLMKIGVPHGAVQFLTRVRRANIAFQRSHSGADMRVWLNGEIIALIDTYFSDEDIELFEVEYPFTGDPVTMWIENAGTHNEAATPDDNGNYTVALVRQQLNPNDVYPATQRYNADTDTTQSTPDGGTTWVDNPSIDPRHSDVYRKPPIVADDPRCQAAANMVAYVKKQIDTVLGVLGAGSGALALATTVLPIFVELGPFAILFELVLAFATFLLGAGASAIDAAFTSDAYDTLLCDFYNNIEADGTVTAGDLGAIESAIAADLAGLANDVLALMLPLMGEVGLSNAGAVGDAASDCTACPWVFRQLGGNGNAHVTPLDDNAFATCPTQTPDYDSGADKYRSDAVTCSGFDAAICELEVIFDNAVHLIRCRITCENSGGTGASTSTRFDLFDSTDTLIETVISPVGGTGGDFFVNGSWDDVKRLFMYTRAEVNSPAFAEITLIEVSGTGTPQPY